MRETDHRPLPLYLLQTAQEKLPEAACLLDLSKHRLDHRLAFRVDSRPDLGLQFSAHAVHPCRSLRQRPSRAGLMAIAIRLSVGSDEALDLSLLQVLEIRFRAIPAIGQNLLGLLPRLR